DSAVVSEGMVAEGAVVGADDETIGHAIEAFVILRESAADNDDVVKELRDHVQAASSPIATPRGIMVVPDLPKTRSGKIMRRLLKDVAEDQIGRASCRDRVEGAAGDVAVKERVSQL